MGFPEFERVMRKTTCIPFDMSGSFTQLYFGRTRDKEINQKKARSQEGKTTKKKFRRSQNPSKRRKGGCIYGEL